MSIIINRIGAFVKVVITGREPEYLHRTLVNLQYNNNSNKITVNCKNFDAYDDAGNCTLEGVVITDEATFDEQVAILFPNEGGGSGDTPNLQAVTDVGNNTNNPVRFIHPDDLTTGVAVESNDPATGAADSNFTQKLQRKDGVIALLSDTGGDITVNGISPDIDRNIVTGFANTSSTGNTGVVHSVLDYLLSIETISPALDDRRAAIESTAGTAWDFSVKSADYDFMHSLIIDLISGFSFSSSNYAGTQFCKILLDSISMRFETQKGIYINSNPGNENEVLTSKGADLPPVWQALPAFIPLSGTIVDAPVTGSIEMVTGYGESRIFKDHVDEDAKMRIGFTESALQVNVESYDGTQFAGITTNKFGTSFYGKPEDKGVSGGVYFEDKTDPNTYAQMQDLDNIAGLQILPAMNNGNAASVDWQPTKRECVGVCETTGMSGALTLYALAGGSGFIDNFTVSILLKMEIGYTFYINTAGVNFTSPAYSLISDGTDRIVVVKCVNGYFSLISNTEAI